VDRAQGLLLDIGGVVLRNARELLLDRDVVEPDDVAWQAMLRHEVSEPDYWADRARFVGTALGHDTWSTRDLMTWLYHEPGVQLVDADVLELMVDTSGAGLALVALTNDMVDFHGQEWVDAQDWLKHFDAVVDAGITGVHKPDPAAYRLGIDAVGCPAEQIVFLDDMPWNVAGALAVGLQAIEVRYDDRQAAVAEARRRLGLAPAGS